jgi:hypothetical protein
MSDPKWKQYELLVAKIQADLAGEHAIVTRDRPQLTTSRIGGISKA